MRYHRIGRAPQVSRLTKHKTKETKHEQARRKSCTRYRWQ
jgi:hypothetical protein